MLLDVRRLRQDKDLVRDLAVDKLIPDIRKCKLVACIITGQKDQVQILVMLGIDLTLELSFFKVDKLDRRLGISSKLAGGLRQKNNMEDAGRAGQNTVKAEEYAQLPLI